MKELDKTYQIGILREQKFVIQHIPRFHPNFKFHSTALK